MQGLSEAMAFGKKANLDMEKVLQVISKGSCAIMANGKSLQNYDKG